jgi:hypothetical protein
MEEVKSREVLSIFENFRIVVSNVGETLRLILEFDGILDWASEEYPLRIVGGEMYGDVFDPDTRTLRKMVELECEGTILIEDLSLTIVVRNFDSGKCVLVNQAQKQLTLFKEECLRCEQGDEILGAGDVACTESYLTFT